MKSFTELYTELQDQTFDTTAAGLVTLKRRINDGIRYIARRTRGVFLNKQTTLTTTASTQFKTLPADVGKIRSVYVTVGSTRYTPRECPNREMWDQLNQTTQTSDYAQYYFIENSSSGKQLGLFPIPATSSNTITVNHQQIFKDLAVTDYSTGTVSITSGLTAITSAGGASFVAAHAGCYIRIHEITTGASGDGLWYKISAVPTSSTLTLASAYLGSTVSGGTYTIGQMSVIPEGHEDGIIDYVLWKHYMRIGDINQAALYKASLDQRIKDLMIDYSSQTENVVLDYGEPREIYNPNLFLTL